MRASDGQAREVEANVAPDACPGPSMSNQQKYFHLLILSRLLHPELGTEHLDGLLEDGEECGAVETLPAGRGDLASAFDPDALVGRERLRLALARPLPFGLARRRATASTVALWSRPPETTASATARWSSAICSLAIS
jgi:hypothetical protein